MYRPEQSLRKKSDGSRITHVLSVLIGAIVIIVAANIALAQEAGFKVGEFVVCRAIEDKQPVGIASEFDSSVGRVYAFLEAVDIERDVQVKFVWYFGDTVTSEVELPLRQGSRWRTYSSKAFGYRIGQWRVELRDGGGSLIQEIEFNVK